MSKTSINAATISKNAAMIAIIDQNIRMLSAQRYNEIL